MEELGRFRLLERLAVGGSAEVFRARLVLADGREVPAVAKRVLPQYARDRRFSGMFEQEARLLQTFDHPNVVRLLDFGEVQGSLLLALEYVDAGDLGALMAAAKVPPPLAAYVVAEVATALEYVHGRTDESGRSLAIVHRDVSPQNILLSTAGEVKLTDFGIAKSTQPRDRTATGIIKGKFAYLSPEQAMPGTPLDGRTDLFALGAVLYELLFGRPPFEGSSEVDTLERLRVAELILDDAWLTPTDRPLAPILRRCLAPAPEARYPSAHELGAELRAYLAALPLTWNRAAVASWVATARAASADAGNLVGQLLGREAPAGGTVVAEPARPARARRPLLIAGGVLLLGTAVAVASMSARRAPAVVTAVVPPPAPPALPVTVAPPAPAPRPAPPRPAARPRPGRLVVNSIPWANVFVDGKRVGTTPLRHPVPAGNHRVILKDGSGKVLRTFAARVGPGDERVFSFEEGR